MFWTLRAAAADSPGSSYAGFKKLSNLVDEALSQIAEDAGVSAVRFNVSAA
jgi:hypothetical protein